MIRGPFLAAKARYRCGWRCARCGAGNRERGEIRAFDRVTWNAFTDNLVDEVDLSGEIAGEKARKRLFRLQERVNVRCWLRGLQATGLCRKCGRRQMWAPVWRHSLAGTAVVATFAALCLLAGIPAEPRRWLLYALACAAVMLLAEAVGLLTVRRRLRRAPEPCRPWVEEICREV